jgi:hypothetical protein
MKLNSFGCSFIFGSDLADDGSNIDYSDYSQLTWPALLAKKIGYEYDCYARAGSGNLRIMERVLSQIATNDRGLYVIGWTWIDRFDYVSSNLDLANPFETAHWQTLMPVDTSDVANIYYKKLHSQLRDKLTTLMCIKLTIDTLKQKQCPFIMTYMDDLIFEKTWHTTPAIVAMQEYIRPYMNEFNGQSFLEWSKSKGFKMSKTLHPLEAAHQAAADLVHQNLDKWTNS